MENVSVATRWPPTKIPSEPESTIWPSLGLLSLSPATAIMGRSRRAAPILKDDPNFTSPLLVWGLLFQAQTDFDFACHATYFLARRVDMEFCFQIARTAACVQLSEFFFIATQRTLGAVGAAPLP